MFKIPDFSATLLSMLVPMSWALSEESQTTGFDDLPQLMKVANQTTFKPFYYHIDFLGNHPEATDTIAGWIYDKWHLYDSSLTKERMMNVYRASEQTDRLPMCFIVLKGNNPVGVVSLKTQTDVELQDISKDTLWLGTPIFIPEENDASHYQALLDFAKKAAKQVGYDKLYVYTSSPENTKRYLCNGATLMEKRVFREHQIDILVFDHLK